MRDTGDQVMQAEPPEVVGHPARRDHGWADAQQRSQMLPEPAVRKPGGQESEDDQRSQQGHRAVTLLDVFEGRHQLILYHFMFAPDVEGWPSAGCPGCSMFVDQVGHLSHLHARDTSLVLVSRAPLQEILRYKKRMGWTVPWFSSAGSDFNVDFGVTTTEGETFGLSVFLRDGDNVFRTYFMDGRGVESLGSVWTFLDLTPLGRQEDWEDSPEGRPQTPPYQWWRRHDEYERHREGD